jgi:hypothetical protein
MKIRVAAFLLLASTDAFTFVSRPTVLNSVTTTGTPRVAQKRPTLLYSATTETDADVMQLLVDVEEEAEKATQEIVDDTCEIDEETGEAVEERLAGR